MSFTELVDELMKGNVASELATMEGFSEFGDALVQQEEIRFYVDGTPNFGHQASTIHIMKRLIDRFSYSGRIKIVYQNAPPGKTPTPDKLALLLTELVPARIDSMTIKYGTCQNITFINYNDRGRLEVEGLGFTGGADNVDVNLAYEIKVAYFLRLQPYLWQAKSQVEKWDLREPLLNLNATHNFTLLAYSYSPTAVSRVPANVWDWYIRQQTYDAALAARTRNAQLLINTADAQDIRLWPIYGLHQFTPADALFNLLLTALQCQETDRRPIVFTLINGVDDGVFAEWLAYINDFVTSFAKIDTTIRGEYGMLSNAVALNNYLRSLDQMRRQYDGTSPITGRILSLQPTRVNDLLPGALESLRPYQILIVPLGPVPQEVYNCLFSKAKMPGFFEGQGTSSLAMSLGLPFFQTSKSTVLSANNYPSRLVLLTELNYEAEARIANANAREVCSVMIHFIQNSRTTPDFLTRSIRGVADFIRDSYTASIDSGLYLYFEGLGEFYKDSNHDKLTLGIVGFEQAILGTAESLSALQRRMLVSPVVAVDEKLTLEQVYAALQENWQGGGVDLITALPNTYLASFYKEVVGKNFFVAVAKENITALSKDGKIYQVTLSNGATSSFGMALTTNCVFTYETGWVMSNMTCLSPEPWTVPGVPWIGFEQPGFNMRITEAKTPVQGAAIGKIAGTPLNISVGYPVIDKKWVITGTFDSPYPSIGLFYQMAGGVNLVNTLPPPLNSLAGFGLSECQIIYDQAGGKIAYSLFVMKTPEPWVIISNPRIAVTPTVNASIFNPGDLKTRAYLFQIFGEFEIGGGTVSIGAQYPDFKLTGSLTDGTIDLSDLAKLFGVEIDLASQVVEFTLLLDPTANEYSITSSIVSNWPISIAGTTLFTITGLGFNVTSSQGIFKVTLTGTTVVLPDDPNFSIGLQLTAGYLGSGNGWLFEGKQTSGQVPLSALLKEYLGWETDQIYAIDGLGLRIETANSSYLFTGKTAEPWVVPFIPSLSVAASLTAGYNGQTGSAITLFNNPTPPVVEPGPFARLETTWVWEGISILLWFDYKPTVKSFGFTWEFLEAEVKPDPKQNNDWIGTLKFNRNVTIGYMVEKMVSWITGSEFGLEAPWSFLNSISLSGFELTYNFTKKTVGFQVKIGPINLGFAKIESIDITYKSGQPKPEDNGVMVTLSGSFPWNIGNDAVGDTSKLGPWDTAKPGTAPAPPGNGNKYFDLRLLAMGQHVTATCFNDATTVQKAIACLASMPDTKPGELPKVTFDAQSSWLIGTEFGVLKFGGDTTPPPTQGQSLALAAPPTPVGYLLTMQVVFNDPRLYALRIALAGDAAKVFKGLDFQIMYRQVSETVGVYQAEITLPDVMRRLSVGAYTIVLPVFGIAVYTNGDFMVDIGFPWNEDFSRSFTIEAIIYPGIPLLGSAGFYFGVLSSATTNKVPAATNGTFNPVLVFGFGMQVGFGKSIEYGILKAGFSLTVVGILEGVIAKWNPYQLQPAGSNSQVQGSYYFWLRGTVGIVGKLYGSVDFAIIKAEVSITLKLILQFTYESFVSISMSVIVSVDVSASIKINLGLFSIRISFSFSMRLKETFTIDNSGTPPWTVSGAKVKGVLLGSVDQRLRSAREPMARAQMLTAAEPNWSNLIAATAPAPIVGYLATALAMARDEWQSAGNQDPKNQEPCYVGMLFIDSVPAVGSAGVVSAAIDSAAPTKVYVRFNTAMNPSTAGTASNYTVSGGLSVTGASMLADTKVVVLTLSAAAVAGKTTVTVNKDLKDATGAALNPPFTKTVLSVSDTSFEQLCKMVLRWAIAAIQPSPLTAEQVDQLVISDTDLTWLLDEILTSTDSNPTPVPPSSIESFMSGQFRFTATIPPNQNEEADATYFPMAPPLKLTLPKYGENYPGYEYVFSDYNSIDNATLGKLREYFDQLAVQVQSEMEPPKKLAAAEPQTFSMANWILSDYFLLIARQMVQSARDALRDFKYEIKSGQTSNSIVEWVNNTAKLEGDFVYTLYDLFASNPEHELNSGKGMKICGATYQAQSTDTFQTIAAMPVYGNAFTAAQLASQPENAANRNLLQPGATIKYNGKPDYIVQPLDSLDIVASNLEVSLTDLLNNSNVLSAPKLIIPVALFVIPPLGYSTQSGDTLQSVAARFAVSIEDLAGGESGMEACQANGDIRDLFSSATDRNLDIPHLPQFKVSELIAEAQRSGAVSQLSGMTSRYYLHGLRLPTDGITPRHTGMWVRNNGGVLSLPPKAGLYALTGQQFPLPILETGSNFSITFDRAAGPDWLLFNNNGTPANQLTIQVVPGSVDALRIQKVAEYARTNILSTGLHMLGAEKMYESQLASYPFTSVIQWQSSDNVRLPYGTPPNAVQSLRLWRLPDSLTNLPDPNTRAINPRLGLMVGRYDEATGATVNTPVSYYGWASIINFTVKTIPPVEGSPSTATMYEIVGGAGSDIALMERLLQEVGGNDSFFDQLILGYAPNQAGDVTQGIQTDPVGRVTMGIQQVNLSTETRPPTTLAAALKEGELEKSRLLNKPAEFIRLLWEASITRSGGFYLYYYNGASESGLPDRIFNDKGETTLGLVALYAKPSKAEDQNRITDFMNFAATGESIDTSNAVVFAITDPPAVPDQVTTNSNTTLEGVAYSYYSDVGDLTESAALLTLAPGAIIRVSQGMYEVPPTGVAPGGSLPAIAQYFGTTEQKIKEANPRITNWPDPLPLYTALKLPVIDAVVGTSPGGSTLDSISHYYHENLTSLGAENSTKAGLFVANQTLKIPGGPTVRNATVAAGVQSVGASRPVPPPVPTDPNTANYAQTFLLNNFSLLNYQVVDNVYFESSNMGLPAGPGSTPSDPENQDKIRAPRLLVEGDNWEYRQSMPYPKFAKALMKVQSDLPDPAESPYFGVGYLFQVAFDWQDIYGNTLVTTLSDPKANNPEPLNQPPILTGYTDSIIGLSQWPSVASSWLVLPGSGGNADLQVTLSFDPSHYEESQTKEWQENAIRDLRVYTNLFYQLTDPNGISYSIQTTLLKGTGALPGNITLSQSQVQDILDWLFYGNQTAGKTSIYQFIADRAKGGTSVAPPPATRPIDNQVGRASLNENQIYELNLSFTIARTGGAVLGDFQTTPGIQSSSNRIPPLVGKSNPDDSTLNLSVFAASFESALSVAGSYSMKVATGVNRGRTSSDPNTDSVWAVRLGLTASEAMSYEVTNKDNPALFAPRPISNTLQSRPQVPIYDYQTGKGISTTPTRKLDFTDIDMDIWGGQFFTAVDGVLSPEFTAATQIVGDNKRVNYLQQILDQKKLLAEITKKWMIAVFDGETADAGSVQEAFYQQLLQKLSNAYATRAGIQFLAKVNADVNEPIAEQPPRLFGNVVQNQPEGSDNGPKSEVSLTSPKIELKTNPATPLAFLLNGPSTVRGAGGEILPNIELDLTYNASSIEHQIGSVRGIDGYVASTWLSFVIPDTPSLISDLGDFAVPLVLRAYPASPSMSAQQGAASHPDADSLNRLTQWNYSFTYGLPYFYPQDTVYCEVDFNVSSNLAAFAAFLDAFPQLAEFVTVFPQVNKDLEGILAMIDATTTDQKQIDDASVALQSFVDLVSRVSTAAGAEGLVVSPPPKSFTSNFVEPYSFTIQEGSALIDGVEALLITVKGKAPSGIKYVWVIVDPDKYDVQPYEGACEGDYCFWYKSKVDGLPLSAADGQKAGLRQVLLTQMDILQRQDAYSTVYLKRNQDLVPGKKTAEAFVYTTPNVQFANPLFPLIDTDRIINIAKIGSPNNEPVHRTLEQQLTELFSDLLKDNVQPTVTFQVNVSYDYPINPTLSAVPLPVFMQSPVPIDVSGSSSSSELTLAQMISNWTQAIQLWARTYNPVQSGGSLWFDLITMSNLTKQPMPLLRLRNLQLETKYIDGGLGESK